MLSMTADRPGCPRDSDAFRAFGADPFEPPDWYALTEPRDREFRSRECREDQHAPGCCGYYPPGRDTYRCLCACHQPPEGATP